MTTIIEKQFLLFNKKINQQISTIIQTNNYMIYDDINTINFDNINTYNLIDIEWNYDNNNFKIPYSNGQKIRILKLLNFQNIFDFISSSSLIPYCEIISGEKITSLADVYVGTQYTLQYNPNATKFQQNMCNVNNIDNFEKINKIFVAGHDINLLYNKFNTSNKIIISHNSDYEINETHLKHIDRCKLQLSQNCLIVHPKLVPLPIGIENTQWFNHDIIESVRLDDSIIKEKNVYFYFSLDTHSSRKYCFDKLKNILQWNTKRSKKDYFIELKKHKYAICPRGNGLDTHRLWECFYLDVIPIMIKKNSVNVENLPIIYLDDWSDLKIDKLENKFKNLKMSKITIDYYKNLINDN